MPNRLSIADGFQFGCGFMAAGCLFYVCVMILAFGAMTLLTLLGVGIAMPQFPLVR